MTGQRIDPKRTMWKMPEQAPTDNIVSPGLLEQFPHLPFRVNTLTGQNLGPPKSSIQSCRSILHASAAGLHVRSVRHHFFRSSPEGGGRGAMYGDMFKTVQSVPDGLLDQLDAQLRSLDEQAWERFYTNKKRFETLTFGLFQEQPDSQRDVSPKHIRIAYAGHVALSVRAYPG